LTTIRSTVEQLDGGHFVGVASEGQFGLETRKVVAEFPVLEGSIDRTLTQVLEGSREMVADAVDVVEKVFAGPGAGESGADLVQVANDGHLGDVLRAEAGGDAAHVAGANGAGLLVPRASAARRYAIVCQYAKEQINL
jgi:hypothetical protein